MAMGLGILLILTVVGYHNSLQNGFLLDDYAVIFGEKGDEPLLGATTLESLGLVLDPFKRRLIAMRMLLV